VAHPIRLKSLKFHTVSATERTDWTFAEVSDGDAVYIVEVTAGGVTKQVVDHLAQMVSKLREHSIDDESEIAGLLGMDSARLQNDHSLAVAVSSVRTAIVGLQASHDRQGLTKFLGGEPRDSVPLYANINRSLLGVRRTPVDFAAAAERAAKEGFSIIKCAPFDDIAHGQATSAILEAAVIGVARVEAVRAAIGPGVDIFVDCHSCFDEESAVVIADKLAESNIAWLEEPIPPATGLPELTRVATRISQPMAGGEDGYGEEFFTDLLESGALRILMPDIKYCGGVAEASRASRAVIQAGGSASLHCPSGPVSQLASASVTAAAAGSMPLEHAVYEAPWRAEVLSPPERIENGRFWFPEGGDGGAELNMDLVRAKGTSWTP
jgi:galactonate dehydratase